MCPCLLNTLLIMYNCEALDVVSALLALFGQLVFATWCTNGTVQCIEKYTVKLSDK